jgi:ribosomal protein S18 acetylase RimI-like enzyme
MTEFSFRPIEPNDMGFLYQVYASTRMDEMALFGWPEAQIQFFLQMQFNMQHTQWRQMTPDAEFSIILVDGEPAGRLYVDRRIGEIHLIEITLLPAYRNRGIGSQIIQDLLNEAAQKKCSLSLHVQKDNPAVRLYRGLDFKVVGENDVYQLMEWKQQPIPE